MTIIKKFDTDEIDKQKFPKFWVSLTVIFLISLVLIEIWVNNTTVAYGVKFEKMAALEQQLLMENQILENEIAKNSSLSNISSKSAELGFLRPKRVEYIR